MACPLCGKASRRTTKALMRSTSNPSRPQLPCARCSPLRRATETLTSSIRSAGVMDTSRPRSVGAPQALPSTMGLTSVVVWRALQEGPMQRRSSPTYRCLLLDSVPISRQLRIKAASIITQGMRANLTARAISKAVDTDSKTRATCTEGKTLV